MSDAVRISACVDCATPIIGERLRCPACHRVHAVVLGESSIGTPSARSDVAVSLLARWVVAAEMICIVVLGLALAVRGCTP